MLNGLLNVYKEKGYTSHDVVAKLRGILKQKKIGHTGTLDPEAEGVLPICLGKGTKVSGLLTDADKVYEATLVLGQVTDTQDFTGKILEEKPVNVDQQEIERVVTSFVGPYLQIPPMYSALKIGGRKLYELAREGKVVERAPRKVQIHQIEVLGITKTQVKMRVHCSKGTYIRTLCHDIGQQLGCGGHMLKLTRTRVGGFKKEDSLTLDQIEAVKKKDQLQVIPIDTVFMSYMPLTVNHKYDKILYNGNVLPIEAINEEKVAFSEKVSYRIYDGQGTFIGIYQYQPSTKGIKPVKVFL